MLVGRCLRRPGGGAPETEGATPEGSYPFKDESGLQRRYFGAKTHVRAGSSPV